MELILLLSVFQAGSLVAQETCWWSFFVFHGNKEIIGSNLSCRLEGEYIFCTSRRSPEGLRWAGNAVSLLFCGLRVKFVKRFQFDDKPWTCKNMTSLCTDENFLITTS